MTYYEKTKVSGTCSVIMLNREPVNLVHVIVSNVLPCKGVIYDPNTFGFVEVVGFGFTVAELGKPLYSLVYSDERIAKLKRDEFAKKIANAKGGEYLFI